MKIITGIKPIPLLAFFALLFSVVAPLVPVNTASAAQLTQAVVRLDRLAYSNANTGGRVCAKPATTAVENKIVLTFPTNSATDYVTSTTLTDWAATGVADASLGASAWPGLSATSATSVNAGTKTVTWTMSAGDPVVGTLYCFQFASGLTNANNNTENSPGTLATQTSAAAPIDSGFFSIGLASPATTGDQVSISGVTVPPIFTFALNSNTDSFSQNLSLTTPRFSAGNTPSTKTISISTNAANGYVVWVKSGTDPLTYKSSTATGRGSLKSNTTSAYLYPTAIVGSAARTMSNGSQDYGLGVFMGTNGSGVTPNSTYYGGAGRTQIGTLDATAFQPIVSATSPTASDVINVYFGASMSTSTIAASDYADTVTYVGAGLF